jgi:hypothetical protein
MRTLFMWITALGTRVLRGPEWELFRVGLSTLWDEIESQPDDEEPGLTTVKAFDRLTRPERLALLAQVGKGLHDRREPCPDLSALNEAAVAAVFAQVRYLVSVEIDAQRSGFGTFSRRRTDRPRQLVLAAAREVDPERRADLPKARSTNLSEWFDVIQTMLFRILDDIDYLAADSFLDLPPSRSRSMKDMLGIPEDYFSTPPDFPTPQMLEAIRADLRRICGRPNAWLTPP